MAPIVDGLGVGNQATVGRHYSDRFAGIEIGTEGARDARIQDPEPVYTPLDLHDGPGPAVGHYHVAPQARVAVVVITEGPVCREHRIRESQRNVEVTLGEQFPLKRIMNVVLRGKTRVHVRSSVVDCVIVEPQRACMLAVGEAVVLVEPGMGDVTGIAVKLGQRG